jgi:hypothetical protein
MDAQAIRRAALITLRRAICERFPPGPVREQWLACVARACEEVCAIQCWPAGGVPCAGAHGQVARIAAITPTAAGFCQSCGCWSCRFRAGAHAIAATTVLPLCAEPTRHSRAELD